MPLLCMVNPMIPVQWLDSNYDSLKVYSACMTFILGASFEYSRFEIVETSLIKSDLISVTSDGSWFGVIMQSWFRD